MISLHNTINNYNFVADIITQMTKKGFWEFVIY